MRQRPLLAPSGSAARRPAPCTLDLLPLSLRWTPDPLRHSPRGRTFPPPPRETLAIHIPHSGQSM